MQLLVQTLDESGEYIVGSSTIKATVLPKKQELILLDNDRLYVVEQTGFKQHGDDLVPLIQVTPAQPSLLAQER